MIVVRTPSLSERSSLSFSAEGGYVSGQTSISVDSDIRSSTSGNNCLVINTFGLSIMFRLQQYEFESIVTSNAGDFPVVCRMLYLTGILLDIWRIEWPCF